MNERKNKKRGRPIGYKAVDPKNISLPVKVSETELNAYKAASEREEMTFSAWVRDKLDKASK